MGASDPIFGIVDMFRKDKNPIKANLSIGVYRTAEGQAHVFRAVRKVEEELAKFEGNKEYDTRVGDENFLRLARELIFGAGSPYLDKVFACLSFIRLHLYKPSQVAEH
jgi:aspartate/tyrosine/aromatic aminotransferase